MKEKNDIPLKLKEVLYFWFDEYGSEYWFKSDNNFDLAIKSRFSDIHAVASNGALEEWRNTSKNRLAEIIILDQFSRNIYRDDPRAFSSDNLALSLAKEAIVMGADKDFNQAEKWMLYMPFMHSESIVAHETAINLFTELGMKHVLDYEIKHKVIIDKFGRYPHRNKLLGRESTEEELEFLKKPDSSF